MRALNDGLLEQEALKGSFKEHLTLCLSCLACETACPSGVQYGKLIEMTHRSIEAASDSGLFSRWIHWLGLEFFLPHIHRLKFLAGIFWAYQVSGVQHFVRKFNLLPGILRIWENFLPKISLGHLDTRQVAAPLGARRGKVAFFHGCIQEAFLTKINASTIQVLQANGFEVHIPSNQTCCGAAQNHSGRTELVRDLARQNIDAFMGEDYDAIINNAGGCGYALQNYPHLLMDDPEYAHKAIAFAGKVKDFSLFLSENLHHKPTGRINQSVTYLDSCHLRHGQKIFSQPRELLKLIPDLELIELRDPDLCCGSAGTYNLSLPDVSDAILTEKIESISQTGASIVVTANTGCHLQLQSGIRRSGSDIQVLHIAELLDLSYRCENPEIKLETKTGKPLDPQIADSKRWLAWQERRRSSQPANLPLQALMDQLQEGQVIHDPIELLVYEQDASIEKGLPSAVVFPYSVQDVQKILRWSKENKIPVLGRGSGTSLTGSSVAEMGDVILSFSHMRSVSELDQIGRTVVVQPGAIIETIAENVSAKNFYYPPDPASGRCATIGGAISTNAGGPHCFKYGVTSNYVQGLELVLADGSKLRVGGAALDYPEYDLVGLILGNEGTLAMITEATLRLITKPPAYRTMMTFFETIEQAGNAVSVIIAQGFLPATIEMINQLLIQAIEEYTHIGLSTDAGAMIIVEVDGYVDSVTLQIEEICQELEKHGAYDTRIAQSEEERAMIWYSRTSAHGASATIAPYIYEVDGAIPRNKLAQCIRGINQISADLDLPYGFLSHAGDGNLHPNFFIQDPDDVEFMNRIYEGGQRLSELFVGLGGTITGEHGIGIEKRELMPLMYNRDELAVMKEIKDVFDPENLLNPGKIFPTEFHNSLPEPRETTSLSTSDKPGTSEETSDLIRSWYEENFSIGIRGGGTKSSPFSKPGKILSTANLRGIQSLTPEELSITVKAGTTLSELNAHLSTEGMKIPLSSPWAEATIGGIISTNFNAPFRLRYGSMRDLVQALKVVLPDGRIIRTGRPLMKDVAGYDMKKLFIGSFGTLAVITEASIKLTPLPRASYTVAVPIKRIEDGIELGSLLLKTSLVASSILLCHSVENPGWRATDLLLYSMEGLAEEVAAETRVVTEFLQEMGYGESDHFDGSGTDLWADWIRKNSDDYTLFRIGIPPKEMKNLLSGPNNSAIKNSEYIVDLPSGLIYMKGIVDISPLRQEISRLNGYAMVINPSSLPSSEFDSWGYTPESIGVMQTIKSKWDAKGLLNPKSFIV